MTVVAPRIADAKGIEESGARPGLLVVASALGGALLGMGALWWSWRRFSTTPDVVDVLTGLVLLTGGVIVARSPRRQRAACLVIVAGVAWFVPDLAPLVGNPGWSDALLRVSPVHIGLLGVALLEFAPRRSPVRLEWAAVAAAAFVAVSAWTGGWQIALPAMGIAILLVANSVIAPHRFRRDWWAVACFVFSAELVGAAIIRSVDSGLAAERWLVPMHQIAVIATVVLLALVEVDGANIDSIELDFDTSADLDSVIAGVLGVANVEVALASPGGGWIDALGHRSRLDTGSGRVVTDERGEVAAALIGVGLGEVTPSNSLRHALGLARDHAQLRATVAAQVVELEASRRRILDAQDEARSKVFATLASGPLAELRSIEDLLSGSGNSTDLQRRAARARGAISQLARGLDPLGAGTSLDVALSELVADSPVEVHLVGPNGLTNDGTAIDRDVARTVWFCVSEALANVAKHAPGAAADVVVSIEGPHVVAVVSDNGPGGADLAGSGLSGLADRAEAQGGTLLVDSPTGGGTRVELFL